MRNTRDHLARVLECQQILASVMPSRKFLLLFVSTYVREMIEEVGFPCCQSSRDFAVPHQDVSYTKPCGCELANSLRTCGAGSSLATGLDCWPLFLELAMPVWKKSIAIRFYV